MHDGCAVRFASVKSATGATDLLWSQTRDAPIVHSALGVRVGWVGWEGELRNECSVHALRNDSSGSHTADATSMAATYHRVKTASRLSCGWLTAINEPKKIQSVSGLKTHHKATLFSFCRVA